MIESQLLREHGGVIIDFKKNQTIFFEGNMPLFYHQIIKGSVRMVNINENGKEFIQGIFNKGESFGEPVLFIEEPYPASAVANEDTTVVKLNKERFLRILDQYPKILLQLTKVFAGRIYNKSIISKEIAIYNPEHRIFTILNMFKKNVANAEGKYDKIEISRQQIADMTGLRVETVIRTIKALQKKEKIRIERGKIYMQEKKLYNYNMP